MGRKRVKKCDPRRKDNNTECNVAVDRISKLPDPIIHHILSFVPTVDVVRMSVLSRRWRWMWHSVPTLLFMPYGFKHWKSFSVFVEKCLKHRRRAMRFIDASALTSLTLDDYGIYNAELLAGLIKWLVSDTIMRNLKEIDLWLNPPDANKNPYRLPSSVLNTRSLTRLKLSGFIEIIDSRSVDLSSLKLLCLDSVMLESETLYDIIIGCPSLEKFVFQKEFYSDFDDVRVSSLSLKSLVIFGQFKTVEIKARNLQSLEMHCGFDKLDFFACREVRDLILSSLRLAEGKIFEDHISQLPLLENLTLRTCSEYTQMNISSKSLKHFYLRKDHENELKLATETPNLVSFNYKGNMEFRMSMMGTYGQVAGQFSIIGSCDLIKFISNINCAWNSVELYVNNLNKDLFIPKNPRNISLPPGHLLKHMKVKIRDEWSDGKICLTIHLETAL